MSEPLSRTQLPAWQQLNLLAHSMQNLHLRQLWTDPLRAERFSCRAGPLLLDFGKQRMTAEVLAGLVKLADDCKLGQAIRDLVGGATVNNTESRPALHTALRLPVEASLKVDGQDVVPLIHTSLNHMRDIVGRIHSKQWRGYSGKAIKDVINIGVGGSDLGPFMACKALGEFIPEQGRQLNVHFVSSIDGTQIADLLGNLQPETTLFIISSKSFTTVDTLSNARTALQWLLADVGGDAELVLRHHFIGVSSRADRMSAWGIPEANQINLWEWVGGRFSLWSAIGLPIALTLGMAGFEEMLAGAHFMDRHFQEAEPTANLPVLLGLIGVWNATFLDIRAHAVLPYDGRLKFFPSYLSQLEMESNGKSVNRLGHSFDYATCPVLWGEVGPNAQHAFYQLLHQGTQAVSCDFIAPVQRYHEREGEGSTELLVQHRLALANCLAQSRVLMLGDSCVADGENAPGFRRYRGNQPSSTILLDELTPYSLGALVALYEHKVYVMSVIWDINPFDQWGVELGKQIADTTFQALSDGHCEGFDGSTNHLLAAIVRGGEELS